MVATLAFTEDSLPRKQGFLQELEEILRELSNIGF